MSADNSPLKIGLVARFLVVCVAWSLLFPFAFFAAVAFGTASNNSNLALGLIVAACAVIGAAFIRGAAPRKNHWVASAVWLGLTVCLLTAFAGIGLGEVMAFCSTTQCNVF